MKLFIPTLALLIGCMGCLSDNRDYNNLVQLSDTLVVKLKPNLVVEIYQFKNGDSSNIKLVGEEYYYNQFKLSCKYSDYWESEFDGISDGESHFYYNKHGKLICQKYSGGISPFDTILNKTYYYKTKRISRTEQYTYAPISDEDDEWDCDYVSDSTTKRKWRYDGATFISHDKYNQMIKYYEVGVDNCQKVETKYIFHHNRLSEVYSYYEKNEPSYVETYSYYKDSISMFHRNCDSFPIPFYNELSKVDKNGNVLTLIKFDNKNKFMHKASYAYRNNRLVHYDFYNEANQLKVSHIYKYKKK
jgi:hypothetical protein